MEPVHGKACVGRGLGRPKEAPAPRPESVLVQSPSTPGGLSLQHGGRCVEGPSQESEAVEGALGGLPNSPPAGPFSQALAPPSPTQCLGPEPFQICLPHVTVPGTREPASPLTAAQSGSPRRSESGAAERPPQTRPVVPASAQGGGQTGTWPLWAPGSRCSQAPARHMARGAHAKGSATPGHPSPPHAPRAFRWALGGRSSGSLRPRHACWASGHQAQSQQGPVLPPTTAHGGRRLLACLPPCQAGHRLSRAPHAFYNKRKPSSPLAWPWGGRAGTEPGL